MSKPRIKIMRIFAGKGHKMEQLAKFVSEHIGDDTSKLLLAKSKRPDIDMELAVCCIESRRKLKGKVPEWIDNPYLIFPIRLSAEQCSSSATAHYKATLAESIACQSSSIDRIEGYSGKNWRIADLTGGLGVDSWFFSKKAYEVLYNEMQPILCEATRHNFRTLGSSNIRISCKAAGYGAEEASPGEILSGFCPDIVYLDPARRGEGGKKVFLIEECTPDILELQKEIFGLSRHILVKLSPMADITMACSRLGRTCREVHIVASGGECKELLIWMDREWDEEYSIHAAELPNDYPESSPAIFSFRPSEEKSASHYGITAKVSAERYLFEPGKAMMKSGAFNLISERKGISKIGKSTHYYAFSDIDKAENLKSFGKVYEILRCDPLDKRSLKAAGKDFPKAEATARNIPMDTVALRKKLGITSGDDAHIFGIKSDSEGNILLCTKRVL